jgi:hypothetical protein
MAEDKSSLEVIPFRGSLGKHTRQSSGTPLRFAKKSTEKRRKMVGAVTNLSLAPNISQDPGGFGASWILRFFASVEGLAWL